MNGSSELTKPQRPARNGGTIPAPPPNRCPAVVPRQPMVCGAKKPVLAAPVDDQDSASRIICEPFGTLGPHSLPRAGIVVETDKSTALLAQMFMLYDIWALSSF